MALSPISPRWFPSPPLYICSSLKLHQASKTSIQHKQAHLPIFLASILALLILQGTNAVEFPVTNSVPNTPGGQVYTNEVGDAYIKDTLQSATTFIWQTFRQDHRDVPVVNVFVDTKPEELGPGVVAYVSNNELHIGAKFLADNKGNAKAALTGVLYHETVHIWQWNGNGNAPTYLTEGIADFVRLKANYIPSHWVKPGGGSSWKQSYDVTARFLDYCNDLKGGFVADLNSRLKTGYSDSFFVELLGKTPEQLFSDYKAKYGQV